MVQTLEKSRRMDAGERLLTQRDRRADGGARHVRVTRGDILIARRFGGIEMIIAAPVAAYRGVGLAILDDVQGGAIHRLVLVHRDADLDIVLGESCDKADAQVARAALAALAAWAAWAAWFGLPRLAMRDEEWSIVAPMACAHAAVLRRRPLSQAHRRPAALARLRTGEAQRSADVARKGGENIVRD